MKLYLTIFLLFLTACSNVQVIALDEVKGQNQYILKKYEDGNIPRVESYTLYKKTIQLCPIGNSFEYKRTFKDEANYAATEGYQIEWRITCSDKPRKSYKIFNLTTLQTGT